jgi:hypothetical protein
MTENCLMSTIKYPLPVKYFTAIAYNNPEHIEIVCRDLESLFSPIEGKTRPYNFSKFTGYYQKEMGDNLEKIFVIFSNLESPDLLADKKVATNKIEERYIVDSKRSVNIDPGYISEAKVVLATTKNYVHRLYLNSGIYGDVHLQFIEKSFRKQPWTYPDYQQDGMIKFFNEQRKKYLKQLADVRAEMK